jgi:hypothetical protein
LVKKIKEKKFEKIAVFRRKYVKTNRSALYTFILAWFLAVQGLVTVSFLLSVTSLILLALIYFHIQIKTASTTLTTVIVQNLLTGN